MKFYDEEEENGYEEEIHEKKTNEKNGYEKKENGYEEETLKIFF